ncbi:unnamed protein product [Urochloa decumbens]|uniref:BTB domain-containing protein n=1 Tax=Urochloa decumbens TaxID=240449 RepID=A0ABC9EWF0_9POAL
MSGCDVKTEGRFALWEVGCSDYHRASNPFTMGLWRWHLRISKHKEKTCVELLVQPHSEKNVHPIVTFKMRVRPLPPNPAIRADHIEIFDLPLRMNGFAWMLDSFVTVRFLIEVKFLDLKITDQINHGQTSIWPSFTTSNGSIRAHSNVLSARSPVFRSMFSHNLKEKQLSAVHIPDMTIDECQCFINYMYDNLEEKYFIAHRVALLGAAEKYDVSDLKVACHDSLSQDLDTENLIERLQVAHFYQLPELKRSCIRLLVDLMKVYEIHDDFNEFIKTADTGLVVEILQHVLGSKLTGVF